MAYRAAVTDGPELRTSRLLLRRWRDDDRDAFAAINADPVVMEHFPAPLGRQESDALADRIESGFEQRGWGLWAVEVPGTAAFVGFVGLNPATFDAPFTPAVEVGWRLAREHWGRGYATEGAHAALAFGFETLALDEIFSFTTYGNTRSRGVMQRLGMRHDPGDDFDNPNVPAGDPLRPHVLYRVDGTSWQRERSPAPR
jgi:ribosomal-protein-alanine N-acetyltransferase